MKKQLLFLISILIASSGLIFACPSPVNIAINPSLLPVGGVSSVSYVSYDIDPGDTSFHVTSEQVTTTVSSPAGATAPTISADNKSVTWNSAGVYTVTITVKITSTDGHTTEVRSNTAIPTVTVVAVKRIEYKWGNLGWIDATTPPVNYVPINTNVDFQALPDPADADWPGGKPVWGGSLSGSGVATVSTNFSNSGYYAISAECGNTVNGQMCAVKVNSLLPDNIEQEIDDGDGNSDTRTFVVNMTTNAGDVVTVTATPAPIVTEASLPACWTLAATEGTANGAGKLVRTIDRTHPSKTVIQCSCGNTKITTVYVVLCTYSALCDDTGLVGHGWWNLSIAPASAVPGVLNRLNTRFTPIINIDGGFWPARSHHVYDAGYILIGSQRGHMPTAWHVWPIPFHDLVYGLTDLSAWRGAYGNYAFDTRNCVWGTLRIGDDCGCGMPIFDYIPPPFPLQGFWHPKQLAAWLRSNP